MCLSLRPPGLVGPVRYDELDPVLNISPSSAPTTRAAFLLTARARRREASARSSRRHTGYLAAGDTQGTGDRVRDMTMSEFLVAVWVVRERLPRARTARVPVAMVGDGLPWEATVAGDRLEVGAYARVRGSILNPVMEGDFLVLLYERHSAAQWLVDVGDGGKVVFADLFAVQSNKLRRVFEHFDTPAFASQYFQCQDLCGAPVALWPHGVPCRGTGERP